MSENEKKPVTLKELVVLFAKSAGVLPPPFDKFASKLAVLTRHVMRIDQKLNAIDKLLAQMAGVMVEMKAPPTEATEQPTQPEAQPEQPPTEESSGDPVEDAFEAAKKDLAARAHKVREDSSEQAAS